LQIAKSRLNVLICERRKLELFCLEKMVDGT